MEKKNTLPVLLTDNFFLFPSCTQVLTLENNESLKRLLVTSWKKHNGRILIVSSRYTLEEKDLKFYDHNKFFNYGTLAKIEIDFSIDADIELVFNSLRDIQIIGLERIKISDFYQVNENEIWYANYSIISDDLTLSSSQKTKINDLVKKLAGLFSGLLQKNDSNLSYLVVSANGDVGNLIDFFVQDSKNLDRNFKQAMLEEHRLEERLKILMDLDKSIKKADQNTKLKTNERIIEQQTVAYLKEQLSSIQTQISELEGTENYKDHYLRRLREESFPEHVKKTVSEELKNYEKTSPYSPDGNTIRTYIEWIMSLPWYKVKEDKKNSVQLIRKQLNKDHYGLQKVKDKIVEYFAVFENIRNSEDSSFLGKEENEND